MTEQQFYTLVKEMREAHRAAIHASQHGTTDYYGVVKRWEDAESKVDQAIKEYFETNKNKRK